MADKLNSMRLLDRQRITYTIHEYDPAAPDAVAVAAAIGVPAAQVCKTLVVLGAGVRPALAMVPADCQLDLKRLATLAGVKRCEMAPHAEAERLTGLRVGGIGALALTAKRWPSYLDESALAHPIIYVNAGQRGVMIGLAPTDLVRVVGAVVGAIAVRSVEAASSTTK
ncbi:YbaK/EbsC family protein [uncultured Chloroflexus sp.]|uniref:YbaK/EbsC family protein n=1 Tax=uncultured Chloroflexus sp. TaxID=214040 RepID=UPI00261C16B3|nr:YbaK/EbsC family protein [uncultured Chloroflexus sp.]